MLINSVAAGRLLRDIVPYHDEIGIRFQDGIEARVAWDSQGPELKSIEQNIITDEVCMEKRFRFCIGKRIASTATEYADGPDGRRLHIQFEDGHVIVVSFRRQPEVRKVDVKVPIPFPAALIATAGRM